MERIDIRPAWWKTVLVFSGGAGFVVVGLWMIAIGSLTEKAAGLLSVLLFGGLGAYGVLKGSKGQPRLALMTAGLEFALPGMAPRLIPWRDIEGFGSCAIAGQDVTTIRLRSYNSFLQGMNQADARAAVRFFNTMRIAGLATVGVGTVNGEDCSELWTTVTGLEHVTSVAAMLGQCRRQYGGEFQLGWNLRDRDAKAFAVYLEELRRAHTTD